MCLLHFEEPPPSRRVPFYSYERNGKRRKRIKEREKKRDKDREMKREGKEKKKEERKTERKTRNLYPKAGKRAAGNADIRAIR